MAIDQSYTATGVETHSDSNHSDAVSYINLARNTEVTRYQNPVLFVLPEGRHVVVSFFDRASAEAASYDANNFQQGSIKGIRLYAPPATTPPQYLTATQLSRKVTLSWHNNEVERVLRNVISRDGQVVAIVDAASTFSESNVPTGAHTYVVKSENIVGSSTATVQITVT